ncbi:conjugal transfer protein TraG N-terminal domain-containing protein [Serratia fonticola]|uniref:conjugal transfer protein TraG N-terminal domain-containing protein n=1 Tax=Serratia fonticola TaxID=47917 RepID=UPI001377F1FA|nr:conjugal transfer protein TraG [Serratia fonticola]
MVTNSYLEYFLTLLGWVINNGIWGILTTTGIFLLPLLGRIVGLWLKVREEGEDEGNKGALLLPRVEHAVYMAMCVIFFTCLPMFDVSLSTLQFDISRSKTCGYSIPNRPDATGYGGLVSELAGQSAAVPAWWMFTHLMSKGMTQAAVQTLPCKPDLRQIRFEVQHTRVSDPAFADELQAFANDCYAPARYRWKSLTKNNPPADRGTLQDIGWIGSQYFLETDGYYNAFHARTPQRAWPWTKARDDGFYNNGTGGYPTCREWWSDKGKGLKDRALTLIKPTTWEHIKKLGQTQAVYENAVLRKLVSPRNIVLSQGGQVYPGYGGNLDPTVINAFTRMGTTVGMATGSLGAFPGFDAMRQALPMVQALLLMALTLCTPLVLVFSAYELKTAVTLTFVQFALIFLTFWWELARWLDSWMLEALYGGAAHSSWNMAGIQNTQDDLIVMFVMGTMFVVLPAFWIAALGWTGVSIGHVLGTLAADGASKAQQGGGKAGDIATNAIRSFSGGVDTGMKAAEKANK